MIRGAPLHRLILGKGSFEPSFFVEDTWERSISELLLRERLLAFERS